MNTKIMTPPEVIAKLEDIAAKSPPTPGPWRVVPSTAGGGTLRRDVVSDGAEFSPAFVAGDILLPDAELIAMVPDLIETLKVAIFRVRLAREEGDTILKAWLPEAEALLAKAEKNIAA